MTSRQRNRKEARGSGDEPVAVGSVERGAKRGLACVDEEDGPAMKATDGQPHGGNSGKKTAIRGKGVTDGRLTINIFFDTRGTFCYGDVSNVAPFHMWGSQEW